MSNESSSRKPPLVLPPVFTAINHSFARPTKALAQALSAVGELRGLGITPAVRLSTSGNRGGGYMANFDDAEITHKSEIVGD